MQGLGGNAGNETQGFLPASPHSAVSATTLAQPPRQSSVSGTPGTRAAAVLQTPAVGCEAGIELFPEHRGGSGPPGPPRHPAVSQPRAARLGGPAARVDSRAISGTRPAGLRARPSTGKGPRARTERVRAFREGSAGRPAAVAPGRPAGDCGTRKPPAPPGSGAAGGCGRGKSDLLTPLAEGRGRPALTGLDWLPGRRPRPQRLHCRRALGGDLR